MKSIIRVIDGTIVTGHYNRNGQFVDVRPVKVVVEYPRYKVTKEMFAAECRIVLNTSCPIQEVVGDDIINTGYSIYLGRKNITPEFYTIDGQQFPLGYECCTWEEWEHCHETQKKREEEYKEETRYNQERDKATYLSQKNVEYWAEYILSNYPKESRRFSSGRNIRFDIPRPPQYDSYLWECNFYELLRKKISSILEERSKQKRSAYVQ